MNIGEIVGYSGIGFLALVTLATFVSALKVSSVDTVDKTIEDPTLPNKVKDNNLDNVGQVEVKSEPVEKTVSWSERLKKGLSKTRGEVWGKLESILSGKIDEDKLEEVEELLYSTDMGSETISEIMGHLTDQLKKESFDLHEVKQFLFSFLKNKLQGIQETVDLDLFQFNEESKGQTKVIMVVGVNGAGKTTTIGKLATKLKNQGANVYVGACDTFRAAAVDQLEVWCERSGAKMIRAKEGADPSGVAYEALQQALNNKADYCILDTAGRLHVKENLMEELKKNKRVLSKLDEGAPHQVLLVIDSITGQNALRQAEEFNKALGLTGLVFTKCDGSSKAGNAVSIVQKLQVPITYIGVGEHVEDLNIFNTDEYLGALLDINQL